MHLYSGRYWKIKKPRSVWFYPLLLREVLVVITGWARVRRTLTRTQHRCVVLCVCVSTSCWASVCRPIGSGIKTCDLASIQASYSLLSHLSFSLSAYLPPLLLPPLSSRRLFVYAHFEFAHLKWKCDARNSRKCLTCLAGPRWKSWSSRHIKADRNQFFQINSDTVGPASSSPHLLLQKWNIGRNPKKDS